MWLRWLALGVVAAGSGAAMYRLVGQQRSFDVGCIGFMAVLTIWFMLEDLHVDTVYQHDKQRAEHEATVWRQ